MKNDIKVRCILSEPDEKEKKKWIKRIKKANPNIELSSLEFLWESEIRRVSANVLMEEILRLNYVPYTFRENRLEICEQACLALGEELPEFQDIYFKIKQLRENYENRNLKKG